MGMNDDRTFSVPGTWLMTIVTLTMMIMCFVPLNFSRHSLIRILLLLIGLFMFLVLLFALVMFWFGNSAPGIL